MMESECSFNFKNELNLNLFFKQTTTRFFTFKPMIPLNSNID